jgi:hypothetical protein
MRNQFFPDTKLNLKYITFILKALYHSDLEVYSEGTSHVKPSKLFLPLNMTIRVQNDRGLDSNYNPIFTKRIELFIYENAEAFSNNKNADRVKFSVINIVCDLEDKWEYLEGKDVITHFENNYRIKEETNEYANGINKGIEQIEIWFNTNIPVIVDHLRKTK